MKVAFAGGGFVGPALSSACFTCTKKFVILTWGGGFMDLPLPLEGI